MDHKPTPNRHLPSRTVSNSNTPVPRHSNTPQMQSRSAQRGSDPRSTDPNRRRRKAVLLRLPRYQPQLAPVKQRGKSVLAQKHLHPKLRQMRRHFDGARNGLVESAGMINDRLIDAKARHEKALARMKKSKEAAEEEEGGDGDAVDELNREMEEKEKQIAEFEERVDKLTRELEQRMRKNIDYEARLATALETVRRVGQAPSQGEGAQTQGTKRRRGEGDEGVDEDGGSNENENENEDGVNDADLPIHNESLQLSKTFKRIIRAKRAQRAEMSLTDKYSTNNAYIEFYRIVHEAKHPGNDIPPLPHPSTWFPPSLEQQNPSFAPTTNITTTTNNNNDSDDDIAIQAERRRLTCPITLRPFRDPVRSTKCPHSFEHEAIVELIQRSRETAVIPIPADDAGADGRRRGRAAAAAAAAGGKKVPCAQCPECSERLTVYDLERDALLARRIRRERERAQMDEEEGEDEEGDGEGEGASEMRVYKESQARGGARGAGLGLEGVKREGEREVSRVPDTQVS
ncbi:hypothetical protein FQN50_002344 [Emmonsiellopsis sp. PD_5]|nr:hypothetical protein FQN50_002344 [Emmonsiellopsis sp. PD_5]